MTILSWDEIAAVTRQAGWEPGPAAIAVSITMPESSRDDAAVQAGQPYATTGWGLWQITPGDSEPQFGIDQAMLNPLNNARAALAKYDGAGGFSPWTTWEHGLNVPYIGDGEAAVAYIWGLPLSQVVQIVNSISGPVTVPNLGDAVVSDWSPDITVATGHVTRIAAAHHHAAVAVTALRPKYTAPTVTIPDPSTILLPPPKDSHAR